jgi:hypothetical protein
MNASIWFVVETNYSVNYNKNMFKYNIEVTAPTTQAALSVASLQLSAASETDAISVRQSQRLFVAIVSQKCDRLIA